MKKFTLLFVLMLATSMIFAQAETARIPNHNSTITKEGLELLKQNQPASRNGVIVLTFEGIGDVAYINTYYDGGIDSYGNPGFNYGVQFQAGAAMGLVDEDAGGSGNTANEPSPETVMFFLYENASYMNVPAGFNTGFSFFYAACCYPGGVAVYDGLNGTGNLLASANLPITGYGTGDPNGGAYGNWSPVSMPFPGIARSVVFSGSANYIVFDNITFGSTTPGGDGEPVPISNWALFIGIGLILIAAVIRFRRLI